MADGGVGAGVEKEVGEVRAGDAEVAEGLAFPVVFEIDAIEADKGERWAVRDVEAGCAYDGVDGVVGAV